MKIHTMITIMRSIKVINEFPNINVNVYNMFNIFFFHLIEIKRFSNVFEILYEY